MIFKCRISVNFFLGVLCLKYYLKLMCYIVTPLPVFAYAFVISNTNGFSHIQTKLNITDMFDRVIRHNYISIMNGDYQH